MINWWAIAAIWVFAGAAVAEYGMARKFGWKGTYPTIVVLWPVACLMGLWFVYRHRRERRGR